MITITVIWYCCGTSSKHPFLSLQVYLSFEVLLAVHGTSQVFSTKVPIAPNPPELKITGPDKIGLGDEAKVGVTFVNPLPIKMENVTLNVESDELLNGEGRRGEGRGGEGRGGEGRGGEGRGGEGRGGEKRRGEKRRGEGGRGGEGRGRERRGEERRGEERRGEERRGEGRGGKGEGRGGKGRGREGEEGGGWIAKGRRV